LWLQNNFQREFFERASPESTSIFSALLDLRDEGFEGEAPSSSSRIGVEVRDLTFFDGDPSRFFVDFLGVPSRDLADFLGLEGRLPLEGGRGDAEGERRCKKIAIFFNFLLKKYPLLNPLIRIGFFKVQCQIGVRLAVVVLDVTPVLTGIGC
jgi:hypothetical protein